MGWACAIGAAGVNWDREHGKMLVALVHIAFGVGLRAHVGGSLFGRVGRPLIKVRQRHRVFLVDVAFEFCLQTWTLSCDLSPLTPEPDYSSRKMRRGWWRGKEGEATLTPKNHDQHLH